MAVHGAAGSWQVLARMLAGKPVVVHGDGSSLWTLTHSRDFAKGFVALLGNPHAIGDAVHITSDEWLTWNEIARLLGEAAGVEPTVVHVPSDTVAALDPHWGPSLLGDKSHCAIFDNSKIRGIVPGFEAEIPFAEGAREIAGWYAANPAEQRPDAAFDAILDRIIAAQLSAQTR